MGETERRDIGERETEWRERDRVEGERDRWVGRHMYNKL